MMREFMVLALAIGQLVLPPFLFSQGFNAQQAAVPIASAPNPATPAGYAFIIWGFIYIGSLALAAYQFLPAGRSDPLMPRIGWFCAAGFALCLVWLAAARFGPVWLTVPVIWGMLIALGAAFLIVMRQPAPLTGLQQAMVAVPLALYFGWLSAAAFVNAADVLPGYGFERFGLSAESFGIVIIALASVLTMIVVANTGAYPAYALTVGWALAAIIVRNGTPFHGSSVSSAAAIGILLVFAVAVLVWTGVIGGTKSGTLVT